ncbi:ribosome assembly protein METTL17, mitochondrial-like [Tachypleus tridentatus]|uniref:ribosome assembly protein METTL17, mitochondrial-like n=1 Tax=Tachypleus tridentatus TaxID=6853 RepID=UPI003FD61967
MDEFISVFFIPVEESELQEKALLLEQEELEKDYNKSQESTTEENAKLEQSRKDRVLYKLKRTVYHWKPIDYTSHQGLLYLAGRLAPDYASLVQIFSEVKKQDPEFKPKTVFDFGSGVGSTMWAANSAWGESIGEYFCVDVSSNMNNLAHLLVQGGDVNGRMFMNGIYFRQFLPASNEVRRALFNCKCQLYGYTWRMTCQFMPIHTKLREVSNRHQLLK